MEASGFRKCGEDVRIDFGLGVYGAAAAAATTGIGEEAKINVDEATGSIEIELGQIEPDGGSGHSRTACLLVAPAEKKDRRKFDYTDGNDSTDRETSSQSLFDDSDDDDDEHTLGFATAYADPKVRYRCLGTRTICVEDSYNEGEENQMR